MKRMGGRFERRGQRSEERLMEGLKESAGEEDGRKGAGGGGRGRLVRRQWCYQTLWIFLFECVSLGAEGVCGFCSHSK